MRTLENKPSLPPDHLPVGFAKISRGEHQLWSLCQRSHWSGGLSGCGEGVTLWSWGSREEARGTAAQPPSDLLPGVPLAKPNRKSEGREPRDAVSVHRSASWNTEQVEKDGE